jgi:hypothetical protein
MNILRSIPLSLSAVAALLSISPASAVVLFTDNFTVDANMNDVNFELANGRQGGTLASTTPITYTSRFAGGYQQVGNTSTFPGNSNALLLDFGGAAFLNYDFAAVSSPIAISFDGIVSSGNSTDTQNWIGMQILGNTAQGNFVNQSDFGILFRGTGETQYFDHGTGTVGASGPNTGLDVFNQYMVVLSDAAGTGSAFGTGGSVVSYYENGTLLGTATIGQLTGGYIGFSATNIAGIDNLSIATIPESSSLAIAGLAGGLLLVRRRK